MKKVYSIKGRLRLLVNTVSALLAVLLISVLLILGSYGSHYSRLLHNVTTSSEFNR